MPFSSHTDAAVNKTNAGQTLETSSTEADPTPHHSHTVTGQKRAHEYLQASPTDEGAIAKRSRVSPPVSAKPLTEPTRFSDPTIYKRVDKDIAELQKAREDLLDIQNIIISARTKPLEQLDQKQRFLLSQYKAIDMAHQEREATHRALEHERQVTQNLRGDVQAASTVSNALEIQLQAGQRDLEHERQVTQNLRRDLQAASTVSNTLEMQLHAGQRDLEHERQVTQNLRRDLQAASTVSDRERSAAVYQELADTRYDLTMTNHELDAVNRTNEIGQAYARGIADNLLCGVCELQLLDPVTLPTCNHTICELCYTAPAFDACLACERSTLPGVRPGDDDLHQRLSNIIMVVRQAQAANQEAEADDDEAEYDEAEVDDAEGDADEVDEAEVDDAEGDADEVAANGVRDRTDDGASEPDEI